jgi:hypothetical protein
MVSQKVEERQILRLLHGVFEQKEELVGMCVDDSGEPNGTVIYTELVFDRVEVGSKGRNRILIFLSEEGQASGSVQGCLHRPSLAGTRAQLSGELQQFLISSPFVEQSPGRLQRQLNFRQCTEHGERSRRRARHRDERLGAELGAVPPGIGEPRPGKNRLDPVLLSLLSIPTF